VFQLEGMIMNTKALWGAMELHIEY